MPGLNVPIPVAGEVIEPEWGEIVAGAVLVRFDNLGELAAYGTPDAPTIAFLADVKQYLGWWNIFDGWRILTEPAKVGALAGGGWQASIVQGATNVGREITRSWAQRANGIWHAHVVAKFLSGAPSQAGNPIRVQLPWPLAHVDDVGGAWSFYDASAVKWYVGSVVPHIIDHCSLQLNDVAFRLGQNPNFGIGIDDIVRITAHGTY